VLIRQHQVGAAGTANGDLLRTNQEFLRFSVSGFPL